MERNILLLWCHTMYGIENYFTLRTFITNPYHLLYYIMPAVPVTEYVN